MFHCPLGYLLDLSLSRFLRYNSHCSIRWSIVRVVLHRSPLVNMYLCVIFVCPIIILDITTWSRLFRVGGILVEVIFD